MTLQKLKPCPFCGTDPEWINEIIPDSHYHIRCPNCHIVMKEDRRDKVIGMWNTRHEIQKLHDHYQKQIGEWEDRLKAADEFIRHVPLSGQDNVFGRNLYPIGFIEALEKYQALKHQTPAPK